MLWKYPNFTWVSRQKMKAAIKAGDYNSHKCMFYDVDVLMENCVKKLIQKYKYFYDVKAYSICNYYVIIM